MTLGININVNYEQQPWRTIDGSASWRCMFLYREPCGSGNINMYGYEYEVGND